MTYVLVEQVAKHQGRTSYFCRMTGIGPMGTPDLAEAAKFDSELAARKSPAASFALAAYTPELVADQPLGRGNRQEPKR